MNQEEWAVKAGDAALRGADVSWWWLAIVGAAMIALMMALWRDRSASRRADTLE